MNNKILFIAPHPDDEVLGCGGTMKRFSQQGNDVFVAVITRGSYKLYTPEGINRVREEAKNAHSILGVKETFFMEFIAPELDITPQYLISNQLSSLIKKLEIDTLFIPHRGDIHADHRVVFNAALVAARPVGEYSVKNVYSYETLSETEWAAPFGDDAFIPTFFVDISSQIKDKISAIQCFKSQLKDFPNPRSIEGISSLAKYRGSSVGILAAEAFQTMRVIV